MRDMMPDNQSDQLSINTIRTLSMDAVQAANSGLSGTPMALATVARRLGKRFLQFDHDEYERWGTGRDPHRYRQWSISVRGGIRANQKTKT